MILKNKSLYLLSKQQKKNYVRIRNSLIPIGFILILVSIDGWTTYRSFFKVNHRVTPQDIEQFIHESIADHPGYYKKRALLQLAFERKSKKEQDRVIGAVFTKMLENEFQGAHSFDMTKYDNDVTNEQGIKYNKGITVMYAVIPKYQSSGIGYTLARSTLIYAREFMGCRLLFGWAFMAKRPELILYYVKKLGFKIVGALDYPYKHLINENTDPNCFIFCKNLLGDDHKKSRL